MESVRHTPVYGRSPFVYKDSKNCPGWIFGQTIREKYTLYNDHPPKEKIMLKIPALKVQIAAKKAIKLVKTNVDTKLDALKAREAELEQELKAI